MTGRKLRIFRQKPVPRQEVVHDANDVLKSNPLVGEGIPSHWPAFAEAMQNLNAGEYLKLNPQGEHFKWVFEEEVDEERKVPPKRWYRKHHL